MNPAFLVPGIGGPATLAAGTPLWPSELTAWGTLAVAVVAVTVALFAEWRTSKRLAKQQEKHDQEIAEERRLADERLRTQMEHSDQQLQHEREAADARLQEEHRIAREREQLNQAYALQVVLMKAFADTPEARRLVVNIVNHGMQTITRIEARFTPDGRSVIPPHRQVRVPGQQLALPPELTSMFEESAEGPSYGDTLTPYDAGMSIETDLIGVDRLTDPMAMVRWTDRWGTRWENKHGDVRQIEENERWNP